ncbi:hypothetical protein [Dactylosporangium salmoneum]|uniref:Uncharacterized protein n=1 Tax=Dactylosporangium salmoneum TaxID=53361 RepID=A0ABN3G8X0_9ACTN
MKRATAIPLRNPRTVGVCVHGQSARLTPGGWQCVHNEPEPSEMEQVAAVVLACRICRTHLDPVHTGLGTHPECEPHPSRRRHLRAVST